MAEALGLAAPLLTRALRRASGMRFPGRALFPTTHEMADYLESYAARFELPVRSNTAVDTLTKERRALRA